MGWIHFILLVFCRFYWNVLVSQHSGFHGPKTCCDWLFPFIPCWKNMSPACKLLWSWFWISLGMDLLLSYWAIIHYWVSLGPPETIWTQYLIHAVTWLMSPRLTFNCSGRVSIFMPLFASYIRFKYISCRCEVFQGKSRFFPIWVVHLGILRISLQLAPLYLSVGHFYYDRQTISEELFQV